MFLWCFKDNAEWRGSFPFNAASRSQALQILYLPHYKGNFVCKPIRTAKKFTVLISKAVRQAQW